MPTVFGTSGEKVAEAIETHQPDMVICVGQAGGRQTVTVEKVAINLAEARIPDNAGQQPSDVPLVEDGATAYFTNLPIKAMVKIVMTINYLQRFLIQQELLYVMILCITYYT